MFTCTWYSIVHGITVNTRPASAWISQTTSSTTSCTERCEWRAPSPPFDLRRRRVHVIPRHLRRGQALSEGVHVIVLRLQRGEAHLLLLMLLNVGKGGAQKLWSRADTTAPQTTEQNKHATFRQGLDETSKEALKRSPVCRRPEQTLQVKQRRWNTAAPARITSSAGETASEQPPQHTANRLGRGAGDGCNEGKIEREAVRAQ
ncbi:hypothetical protein EYF80_047645 [Liparis tanakae]|uniref:Uncharacterized protein n=1 Tax=Liparis tanakae TaxID=230148 RepID=A0A4Z2FN32_9TELE|nr:hypothetical protein EYF80_047645 [Liparis tanakae]